MAAMLAVRLAEAREVGECSGWSDHAKVRMAGCLLEARRVPEAARVLGVDLIDDQVPELIRPFRARGPCTKCGATKATTTYHAPDRLRRTCRTCGYSWMEFTRDTAPDLEDPT
jgi:hypothetical protein